MASSSSGLGRRPLKAEIAGSNPVEATKEFSLHKCAGFYCEGCPRARYEYLEPKCRLFAYKPAFVLVTQNFGLQNKISGFA